MYSTQDIVERLRAEFLEMPGLRLTPRQIQRLCGIEANVCRAVLDSLVRAEFLLESANGMYARAFDRRMTRPAKAMATVERLLGDGRVHARRNA